MDLPRGLFQRGPANRQDREKGQKRLQLLDPDANPGDAEVDLRSSSSSPLVDQPEQVAKPPPRLALRHYPESDLVAHQDKRHAEISGQGQEPVEFGERLLLPGRNPEREGIEQDRVPSLRGVKDLVEIADLQCTPTARPALPVEHDAPLQVLVPQGRGHVEDTLASKRGCQPLGESVLPTAGATEDEGANGYSSSLIAATSRPFSSALLTATRKYSGPSPWKGPQPRTSTPRLASRPGRPSGPRASRKFAAPGKGCRPGRASSAPKRSSRRLATSAIEASAKFRSLTAAIPAAAATAFTGHEGWSAWTRPASSQTRQPSRRPGIAKNLVKDRATQSPRSTISVTLIPGTKSAKASSTTRTAPASSTRAATSRTSSRPSMSPVGLFGLQRKTTATPSRSLYEVGSHPKSSSRRRATLRTGSMPEALAAAAYSEKVGSSTSALPPVAAALAARNSASAPPLVGTTISAPTPR